MNFRESVLDYLLSFNGVSYFREKDQRETVRSVCTQKYNNDYKQERRKTKIS